MGAFDKARIVNEFIKEQSHRKGDYYYYINLLNQVQLYIQENKLDSAKAIANGVLNDADLFNQDLQRNAFLLLKEIAYKRNDISSYSEYEELFNIESNKWTEDYAQIKKFLQTVTAIFGTLNYKMKSDLKIRLQK